MRQRGRQHLQKFLAASLHGTASLWFVARFASSLSDRLCSQACRKIGSSQDLSHQVSLMASSLSHELSPSPSSSSSSSFTPVGLLVQRRQVYSPSGNRLDALNISPSKRLRHLQTLAKYCMGFPATVWHQFSSAELLCCWSQLRISTFLPFQSMRQNCLLSTHLLLRN